MIHRKPFIFMWAKNYHLPVFKTQKQTKTLEHKPQDFSYPPCCPLCLCAVLCLVAQACLTLCNHVDCSPRGPSAVGILQARILEWVAMPTSRNSFQPRNWSQVSRIISIFFTVRVTRGTPSLPATSVKWQNNPNENNHSLKKKKKRNELKQKGNANT